MILSVASQLATREGEWEGSRGKREGGGRKRGKGRKEEKEKEKEGGGIAVIFQAEVGGYETVEKYTIFRFSQCGYRYSTNTNVFTVRHTNRYIQKTYIYKHIYIHT